MMVKPKIFICILFWMDYGGMTMPLSSISKNPYEYNMQDFNPKTDVLVNVDFVRLLQYKDPKWMYNSKDWNLLETKTGDMLVANPLNPKSEIKLEYLVEPSPSLKLVFTYLLRQSNFTKLPPTLKVVLKDETSEKILLDLEPAQKWQESSVVFAAKPNSKLIFVANPQYTFNKIILGDIAIAQTVTREMALPNTSMNLTTSLTPLVNVNNSTSTTRSPAENTTSKSNLKPSAPPLVPPEDRYYKKAFSSGLLWQIFLVGTGAAVLAVCVLIACRLRNRHTNEEEIAIYTRKPNFSSDGGYASDIHELTLPQNKKD